MRGEAWWLLAGPAVLVAGLASAQTPEPTTISVSGSLEAVSRYVWRGLALSPGWVVQPTVTVERSGLWLSLWGDVVAEGERRGEFDELDPTLGYDLEYGDLSITPSLVAYHYVGQPGVPDTAELCLELSVPVGPFSLTTSHSVDVRSYHGAYYGEVGASWERELDDAPLTLAATFGVGWGSSRFNEAYAERRATTFDAATLDLAVTWRLSTAAVVRAHLARSVVINGGLRARADEPDLLFGGIALELER